MPVHRRGMSRKRKDQLIAYSFILPNFVGFFILVLIPIVFSIVMSFFNWTGASVRGFIGLQNYIDMWNNVTFQTSFRNSIFYAVFTVPVTMLCSLVVALVLNRKLKGIGFFRAIYFFPHITAVVALAAVWNMMFNPDLGIVNQTLHTLLRIPVESLPRWTVSTKWSLFTVMLAQVWKSTGYYMVIYLAGLQSIPRELYEAATVDGANSWQMFKKVTWPMLSPTTFFVIIMLTIGAFQVFELVWVMTEGGPGQSSYVLVMHIYKMAFVSNKFGYGSAVSVVLFLIVSAITAFQFWAERKWVTY